MEEAIDHANMVYGGTDLQATRVIYVHGSIDAWQALGITKTKIPESPAIFIKGESVVILIIICEGLSFCSFISQKLQKRF